MFLLVFSDLDVELEFRRMLMTSTRGAGNASRARRNAAGIAVGVSDGRFGPVGGEGRLRIIRTKNKKKSEKSNGPRRNVRGIS